MNSLKEIKLSKYPYKSSIIDRDKLFIEMSLKSI